MSGAGRESSSLGGAGRNLPDLRWLLAGAGSLLGVLAVALGVVAGVWLVAGQQRIGDRSIAIWINVGLVAAFALGGWVSSKVRKTRPRESVTGGLVVAAYGLLLIVLLLVLVAELWLDPVTDFRSFAIQMGLEDPAGTPPTDFYGDPSLQPPDTAYDKLFGFFGYATTTVALLVLACVLGAIAGSVDDPDALSASSSVDR